MNVQQLKVQNLLHDQNQKLKDLFTQIFGISLSDPLGVQGNQNSQEQSAYRAMSAATLGDDGKNSKKLRKLNEGSQQIETIMSEVRDNTSQEGSNKNEKEDLDATAVSPTTSEHQQHQEMKMRQQYLQEVFDNVKEKNHKLY